MRCSDADGAQSECVCKGLCYTCSLDYRLIKPEKLELEELTLTQVYLAYLPETKFIKHYKLFTLETKCINHLHC